MQVTPIPCLSDNYAYLLVCSETKEAAIIDPSESEPVLAAVRNRTLAGGREAATVVAILSTHHHHDHVGGNGGVVAALGPLKVYGHASDRGRIPGQTEFLEDGDTFNVGRLLVRVLHIPGHTTGALAYVVTREPEQPVAFTGDTLFSAGCGRLFEGTPGMMHASLSKLAALDGRTRVYPGHEYTESNLKFAAHAEPSNKAIAEARARAAGLRGERKPTVGTTIAEELTYNPFLRVDVPELRRTFGIQESVDSAAAFGVVRKAKDEFR